MLNRRENKQHCIFNLGTLLSVMCVFAVTYYVLLGTRQRPLSISFLLSHTNNLPFSWHVIIIGLIPIYIGLLIFGAGIIGLRSGNSLQAIFINTRK